MPIGFSIRRLTAETSVAPSAPSTERWSQESVMLITVATTIWSPFTTARFSPPPTARIVECGGLITAVKSFTPNIPRFDTALVPPWYSSGFNLRSLARAVKSFISFAIVDSVLVSTARMIGVMRPLFGSATATPTSACLWRSIADSVQETLASGTCASATPSAFTTMSLTDTFQTALPSFWGAEALICSRSASSASISQSTVT